MLTPKSRELYAHSSKIFSISLPISVDLALLFATFFVDTYFLSLFTELPAAAVGALFPVFGLVAMVLRQVAQAGAVVMSSLSGGADHSAVRETQFAILINGLGVGIAVATLLWISSDKITSLLGLPSDAANLAVIYLVVLAPGVVLLSLKHTLSAIGLANQKTGPQMMGATVGILVNIALNSGVIYSSGSDITPEQLVRGVAWATFASYAANVFVLWYFISDKKAFLAVAVSENFGTTLRRIWVKAVPTTLEPAAIQIQWFVLTAFVASFGIEALATRIYVINFEMFVLAWSLAIAIAAQVLVSFEAGRNDRRAASEIVNSANIVGGVGAVVVASLMYWNSDLLVGLFTSDPSILKTASLLFLIAIPIEIAKAIYNTTCWSLVAWGDGTFAVGISITILFGIALPIAWYLSVSMGLGIVGIWLALAIDEILRAGTMVLRWSQLRHRNLEAESLAT